MKGSASGGRLAVLLAALFGLGFGLNYGNSNQTTYVLESVKALHPTIWKRDWLITQTHAYHPAYALLGEWLLRLSPAGWTIAYANVLFNALGMLAIYKVLCLLLARERVLSAFCLVLILASVTRTLGPGVSYAFSEIFQPSTLGAVGLLAAAAAFIADWSLASGLCLAFAGAFHVNYLLLGLCVFGLAQLLNGRDRFLLRAAAGLGPPLLVLCWFAPFLLANVSPGVSTEAHRIYMDVRSPHHYHPGSFRWDFSFWAGFQLIGLAAVLGPARRNKGPERRLLALLIGFWVLVALSVVLSSVVLVRVVQQLFAWRVCAEAELLAQAAFAAALLSVFVEGRRAAILADRGAQLIGAAGVAVLVLGAAVTDKWNITLVVLSLLAVAYAIIKGWLRKLASSEHAGLAVSRVTAALLITLVAVNVARFSRLTRYSNLLSGGERGVTELCQWALTQTPENALFLTPPGEDDLRLACQRAIVVDWKSPPGMASEIVAWFDRIEDVTGRRPFRSDADLVGYQQLDRERVARLRDRYDFDYVVVERGHELDLGVAPAFSGRRFVAYALPSRAQAPLGFSRMR